MEIGENFISVDDHFLQQPILVWSTIFFNKKKDPDFLQTKFICCLLYTSPSPRD